MTDDDGNVYPATNSNKKCAFMYYVRCKQRFDYSKSGKKLPIEIKLLRSFVHV